MSEIVGKADIGLIRLDLPNLRRLAASEPIDLQAAMISEEALPPPHVITRVLAQLDAGTPAFWCLPFLVVVKESTAILGGCEFKGAPINGSVEIGYRVAKSARGRGIASAAVVQLLQLAASTGEVHQVVAHILPDNVASSKVVARLGFSKGHSFVDADDELVVQWAYPVAT